MLVKWPPAVRTPCFSSTVAESFCSVEIARTLYWRPVCLSGDRLQEKMIIDTSACCQRNKMSSTKLIQCWSKHETALSFIFFLYLFNVFFHQGGKFPQTGPKLEEDWTTFSMSFSSATSLSFYARFLSNLLRWKTKGQSWPEMSLWTGVFPDVFLLQVSFAFL